MVSFTHNDAGTSERDWARSGVSDLPELPLDAGELAGAAFIVLAAHPDDESLGAGGLMARLHGLGEQQVLLGEVDGAVRGWLHAAEVHTVESPPYAEIVGLVVDDGHRGQGLGAALVVAAKEWARARGLGEMRVRSNVVRDRAHRFYQRQGFLETKRQAVFRLSL